MFRADKDGIANGGGPCDSSRGRYNRLIVVSISSFICNSTPLQDGRIGAQRRRTILRSGANIAWSSVRKSAASGKTNRWKGEEIRSATNLSQKSGCEENVEVVTPVHCVAFYEHTLHRTMSERRSNERGETPDVVNIQEGRQREGMIQWACQMSRIWTSKMEDTAWT
ncbi:hypothetical protein HETIRDRAFT_430514 [Heterobasidion irregulare TC 32-1]|uniref:Uncharacterized protein n=1 Tax=Heterobasidion irregulare (strain TC 32-1) TaxID=747525 RepID=W4JRQ1_HETIT|nr:uncharacterized protein HETIRDRAFT_430514 [Heterobasidion irregulare TC 32-1]ETW76144.1 hypothetical protein HETIRDRAFT_430514 [Heterobasidion irregulare TC 32-1]